MSGAIPAAVKADLAAACGRLGIDHAALHRCRPAGGDVPALSPWARLLRAAAVALRGGRPVNLGARLPGGVTIEAALREAAIMIAPGVAAT